MQVISGVLMISTIPVWIMFISSILGIEKTNKFQIFGVFLSLLGVLFIITKSDIEVIKNLAFNRGDLIMAIGMFAWALYSALLKKKNASDFTDSIIRGSYNYWLSIFNPNLYFRNESWK